MDIRDTRAGKSLELEGFDINLVGFDCAMEREPWEWDDPWRCPFNPGCGALKAKDCAAIKQFAQIIRAPKRHQ